MVRIIARVMANLPTNFGVYVRFRSCLMGQHLSDALCDIVTLTLTFDYGGHGACSDTGHRALSVYQG